MARVQVHDALDVPRPLNARRILRSSHDELFVRKPAGWNAEQLVNFGLTVRGVRTHVAQVARKPGLQRKVTVLFGIDRTIERNRKTRSQFLLQPFQHRTAGKAEINVQLRKMLFEQVLRTSVVSEASYRDRRIDVIESLYRNAGRQDFLQRGVAIGKIGADHGK